ncbi:heme exporter protein CcmD [Vannielia sp.]|nr:heme exporter protein CcmD [Vannielia sp.]MDF1873431.1 heme exporter protein CcmD [Vannielia sp.]
MPELGKYATEVLLAYAGAIAVLAGLIAVTIAQGRAVRDRLRRMEGDK